MQAYFFLANFQCEAREDSLDALLHSQDWHSLSLQNNQSHDVAYAFDQEESLHDDQARLTGSIFLIEKEVQRYICEEFKLLVTLKLPYTISLASLHVFCSDKHVDICYFCE